MVLASSFLVAAFACVIFATTALPRAGPGQISAAQSALPARIAALIEQLENWLDRESRYAHRADPAKVRLVGVIEEAGLSDGQPAYSASPRRGYYDPATGTIYLAKPWSADDPHDISVLLHELAHHRQQAMQYWACPNAQELPAYRLQDRWLRQQGLRARVNWLAVLMESSCHPRDIHPD